MNSFRRLMFLLLLLAAVIIIGTVGFMIIEHLSFLDALYFTIATISTVGYGDILPTTSGAKIFAIIIIIFGIGSFLTLLTTAAQRLIQSRQIGIHRNRLNMLVGVFFTEVGNPLLHIVTAFDPAVAGVRKDFLVTGQWSAVEFEALKKRLGQYQHQIDPARLDLEKTYRFLGEKGDLLIRQLENPDLAENEAFAELLWATVHLRDELAARSTLKGLPETDIAHLANDIKRVYSLLTLQWIDYMQYLKNRYPFLFSLALRNNPFVEKPSVVINQ